jgi:hypothetical protein
MDLGDIGRNVMIKAAVILSAVGMLTACSSKLDGGTNEQVFYSELIPCYAATSALSGALPRLGAAPEFASMLEESRQILKGEVIAAAKILGKSQSEVDTDIKIASESDAVKAFVGEAAINAGPHLGEKVCPYELRKLKE